MMGYKWHHNKGMVVSHPCTLYTIIRCVVLFSVGRGSMVDMYLNHSDLGLIPQSCLQLELTISSLPLKFLSAKTLVISGRLLFHFSPPLWPNKPLIFCIGVHQHLWSCWSPLVSVHRSFVHLTWHSVCQGELSGIHVWKPPPIPKARHLGKPLKCLHIPEEVLNPKEVPKGTTLL
jgi:hypothetical protein